MFRAPLARAALARLAAAALLVPSPPAAAARPWYVPDHAKLQLAGNVGFLSPGVGYAWGRSLESDVFFGWVPEAFGGDIFSLTGKLVFSPWEIGSRRWRVRLLTAAVQLTYTFGDPYFVIPPEPFVPTALRAGLALGSGVTRRWRGRSVGLYAELVALDLGLAYWLSNRDALGPRDVFSLALGVRLQL